MSTELVSIGTPRNSQYAVQILWHEGICDKINNIQCCGLSKSSRQIIHLLECITDLTEFQKHSIITRFIGIIEDIRKRACFYGYVFHICRTIVTVGSLVVPALLSIQYTSSSPTGVDSESLAYFIYWLTWVISLLVTTSNGILTLFKVDKKYYFLYTTLEQLRSEVWQYIHLSGKYGRVIHNVLPDHKNQYVLLTHNLEKIRLRQIEEEYYKLSENQNTPHERIITDLSGNQQKSIAGLYAPTPNMNQLIARQRELAIAINTPSQVDGRQTSQIQNYEEEQDEKGQDENRQDEKRHDYQGREKESDTPLETPTERR
jgi:hypothetical protein